MLRQAGLLDNELIAGTPEVEVDPRELRQRIEKHLHDQGFVLSNGRLLASVLDDKERLRRLHREAVAHQRDRARESPTPWHWGHRRLGRGMVLQQLPRNSGPSTCSRASDSAWTTAAASSPFSQDTIVSKRPCDPLNAACGISNAYAPIGAPSSRSVADNNQKRSGRSLSRSVPPAPSAPYPALSATLRSAASYLSLTAGSPDAAMHRGPRYVACRLQWVTAWSGCRR
jgi:hypothetical protein